MQCPACEADWPDEIRYCGECGGRMPDATVVASPYKVQVEATDTPHTPPALAPSLPSLTPSLAPPVPVPMPAPEPHRVSDATQLFVPPDPPTLQTVQHIDLSVLEEAWVLVAKRKGNFAVGTLVVLLAIAALSATGVGALACGPLYGGLAIVGLGVASGARRRISVTDFFDGLLVWRPLLLLGFWTALAVSLGTIVLVIPGLYLAMASMYAPFLVVDRGAAPWPALRASIDAVNARLGAHVGLATVLALLNVAGAMPCGLGLLLTVPLSVVALAVCYGRLFGFNADRLH